MIIKSWLSRWALFLLSFSAINLVHAYADEPAKNDYLQTYRDEIKQAETNASQAVLDTLKSNTDSNDREAQQTQPSRKPVAPRSGHSNADKAFSSSAGSTNTVPKSNNNPWLKPNPWAAKQTPNIWERNAKINPYAHAPVPGPTPSSNTSAHLVIPSPPNIFSPSQPPKPNQPRSSANP